MADVNYWEINFFNVGKARCVAKNRRLCRKAIALVFGSKKLDFSKSLSLSLIFNDFVVSTRREGSLRKGRNVVITRRWCCSPGTATRLLFVI